MISPLPTSDQRFLASLDAIGERSARAQRQISSGKRINDASDAPDDVSTVLATRAEQERVRQAATNLGRIKNEVDTAETTLNSGVRLLERARVLAAQAASTTAPGATLTATALEVGDIFRQLVNLSATQSNGRHLFSGDADSTQPFTFVAGPPLATSVYAGTAATRQAIDASGLGFDIARAGDDIFGGSFTALAALYTAISANDRTAIDASLAGVSASLQHLNQVHLYYGTAQNRVAGAIDAASKSELRLEAVLSSLEDADISSAILELNQSQTNLQAALGARANLPQLTLFDYLK